MTNSGAIGYGVIFSYDINTSTYNTVYTFLGDSSSGSYPYSELMQASDGLLYGETYSGGTFNTGTIFSYNIQSGAYSNLVSLNNNTNQGSYLLGTLIQVTLPPINLSGRVVNPLCSYSENDSIIITVTGGTAPYQFNWSNGATTQSLSDLPGGNYNVTVTDAAMNSATAGFTITPPAALTPPVIKATNVSCYESDNGIVTVSTLPTGGTPPYFYTINGGAYQSETTFNPLAAGTYAVIAKDNNGCFDSSNIVAITQPPALTAPVISATSISCYEGSNGTVTISTLPTGGTPPYQYALNGGAFQSNTSFTALPYNSYTATAKDTNGCTIQSNLIVVTQPTALTAPVITGTNLTCNGNSDGTITIRPLPTGGTPPYLYSINGGVIKPGTTITGLAVNTYSVTAKDSNGCTILSNSVVVTQPTALTAPVITGTNLTCNGNSDGTITIRTCQQVAHRLMNTR